MKFFPKINKISKVERTTDSIGRNFGSWIIFKKLFWKVFIFAYAIDLLSKAFFHRFYDYLICYDGEKCDFDSIFIRWVIDGQLYLAHVKHGYRDMTERIMGKQEWEARLLNWASNHVEKLIDYNIPDLYFFYLSPFIVIMFWALLMSIGRNKNSTNILAIGVALYIAGGLGNRTELFFFGWATDFIGLPKDGIIDRIPNFIIPLGSGIANIADFFIHIGRWIFIIGALSMTNYKKEAIPLPQTSNISKDKSLIKKEKS